MKAFLIVCGAVLLGPGFAKAQSLNTTSVDWFNNSSTLFRDAAGNPLFQGAVNLNNDGALVQLGYFSNATPGDNFAGTWIPLTGFGAAPRTTIGDSPDLTGLGAGRIGFNTVFFFGSNLAEVFDPAFDIGAYQTQSSVSITTTSSGGTPPPGQVLAIRFFNTNGTGGQYNTVSADSWLWAAPTAQTSSVLLNVGTASLRWEDPANPFLTTIPEPSTYALLGSATLALFAVSGVRRYRRR